jgi:hypothetical protein
MIELTYRFDPKHLHLYQKLTNDRSAGRGRSGEDTWGLFLVSTLVVAAFLAGAEILFPGLTGEPFAMAEFVAGFVTGIAVILAVMWRRYYRVSRAALRTDGPTLSEHRLTVAADGLRTFSQLTEGYYRWPAFEEVTVEDGVIVLWIEPGAGVLVPRSAFDSSTTEAAFLQAVRGHIAAASPASPKR